MRGHRVSDLRIQRELIEFELVGYGYNTSELDRMRTNKVYRIHRMLEELNKIKKEEADKIAKKGR